jgi:hypothetical protein
MIGPFWRMQKAATFLSITLVAVILTSGVFLTSCANKTIKGQIASNDIGWTVRDPILSKFTHICKNVELKADGEFKKGSATFRGLQIGTQDGTKFSLSLAIPITNPDRINFGTATGALTVSKPISINGIPLPQKIVLEPGKATADVDLLGGMSEFLLNIITSKTLAESDGAAHSIIQSVTIKSTLLDLVSGSTLDLGKLHLTIGPDSKVRLSNLVVDGELNYKGNVQAALNFGKGCTYTGKKTEFKFNGGKANLLLHAVKAAGNYTFDLEAQKSFADLNDCTYSFGAYKQCVAKAAHGILQVENFKWQETEGKASQLFTKSSMRIEKSNLLVKNAKKTFTLTSDFSEPIASKLELNSTNGAIATNWNTTTTNRADRCLIDITPQTSTTSLVLGRTEIGPVALSKEGDLDFSFNQGVSQLQKLKWTNGKKSFNIACAGGSTISIPPNMSMSLLKDKDSSVTRLPLNLKVGKATVSGTKSEIELSNIKGNVLLVVDNGTSLKGGLDFSLVNCDLLGEHQIDVHTNGLNFLSDKKGGRINLSSCKMIVTDKTMSAIINEQLPSESSYEVDKTLLEAQKWRYRNAILKKVSITNTLVKQLKASAPGEERFTVTGDVSIEGTIEKGGLLSVIKKEKTGWEVKPWSATGKVEGDGILKYVIKPQEPFTKSQINYQLSLDLKPAKDVDLDWSNVSDGLLSKAENSIITKFISSYDPKAYLKKATYSFFKTESKKLNNVVVSNVLTAPTKDGLSIAFSAQIKL